MGTTTATTATTATPANTFTSQTLEQKRAQNAWDACANYSKDHVNFAKGLPALIMNSGLMQVMAFCQEKGAKDKTRHVGEVAAHLRAWLHQRFAPTLKGKDFHSFMESFMAEGFTSADYQAISAEAFAWLKWLRQMAAARQPGKEKDQKGV